MKGDGEDSGLRDFLSLGSTSRNASSRSGEREGFSGRAGTPSGDVDSLAMLSSLSRNGLSMLAGCSNGGFSLKPPAVRNLSGMLSLRNLALGGGERTSKVTGGGFTGFYRASVPKATWPSSPGMGLRCVSEETQVKDEPAGTSSSQRGSTGIVGQLEQPLETDVEDLTPDECWRLILQLGTRWPAWNGTPALQSPQVVMKGRSSAFEVSEMVRGHPSHKDERLGGDPGKLQLGQDSLKLLASRALEALAQAPDRYGRHAGNMEAPKLTTQEFFKRKAARDLPTPTSQSAHPTLPVSEVPTFSAEPPTSSSLETAAPKTSSAGPRTAPLTIFYAGTVNVCDNVPEEKARLIMLFAEKAGIHPAPAPSVSCAAPSISASARESPRPQEDLKLSQPSSHSVLVSGTSSVPSHLAHPEGANSYKDPVESSNPTEMATAEQPPMPLRLTVTGGNSRQQGAKPLPNARKNSLARFLDSRKRNRPTASCSEGQTSKKQYAGSPSDGCPSDGDDMKGSGKPPMPLCSQLSVDSKEEITAMCSNDPEVKSYDSLMK